MRFFDFLGNDHHANTVRKGRFGLLNLAALLMVSGLMALSSCESNSYEKRPFVGSDDITELTGGNIDAWLRKAPFDNELKRYEENKLVLTNAKQVFPFMGRYYNAVEELRRERGLAGDTAIYRETEVLFQDSLWGDLFVSATLLYEDQEVFLNERYYEIGNPFFGGTDAVMDSHNAYLYETSVWAKHPRYKTGIYWVSANFSSYLLGFYQQGQLVFEAAVPLVAGDTLATLNKLKEVGAELGLGIAEWDRASVAQLQRVREPETFWEDPFMGLYDSDSYSLSRVYLKTKNTPFEQTVDASQGDYYFSYHSPHGVVELYTTLQSTDKEEEAFNKDHRRMDSYRYRFGEIFYAEEPVDGVVSGNAKIYLKEGQYLVIHYRYPEADSDARQHVHDILRHTKTL